MSLFLLVIENGAGTGSITLLIDLGFFVTHSTNPNESSITWRMYYYAGGQPSGEGSRVALRIAHMPVLPPQPTPTPQPYPAPTPTRST